ncbi:hypothetical protein I316_06995 [Kwoniella heveanensis BCC8398]|uniref:DinB-like domain-containing protein n=1 Tax=Kwoniella heveanensis BCC8398 TaxID=1296120 RepID=A0A1B9GJW6_9TREE|nr:hypothetical protein I316_06995 [Kwoniella heveanensis BCC8398]
MPSRQASASLNHTLVAMPSRDQTDRAEALLSLSIALIESAIDILKVNVTTDEQLCRDSLLMPGGTIGKHLRHVIETFRAFLLPLYPPKGSSSAEVLEINYDSIHPTARRPIARSVSSCLHALEEVRDELIHWGEACRSPTSSSISQSGNGKDVLRGEEVAGGVAGEVGVNRNGLAQAMEREVKVVAITPTRQQMGSTVGRELWYISLHAIHHFSMLRTIAVHEHGLELPVEFGTAPSTLLYRGLSWKPPTENKEVQVTVKSKL